MKTPAARQSAPQASKATAPPAPFQPRTFSLDGEWELAYGEKGEGPTSEWRKVTVPGSVHTQWLPAPL